MPTSCLLFLFLVAEISAIFFGGGGGGCGCNCCQQPPPPPPPICDCASIAKPCYAAAVPPPPPPIPVGSNYAVPPPPPTPLTNAPIPPPSSVDTYSQTIGIQSKIPPSSPIVSSSQERVPASGFSVEPVPISIEKPAPPRFDDYLPPAPPRSRGNVKPTLSFKSKADADDYEILASSGFRRKPQKRSKDAKCVNEQLRRIILKSISETSSATEARLSISLAAKAHFGYNFDVICAEKPFIFKVNSDLYCELSIDDTFCLAFQH